jgi:hypothetical protein
VPVSPDAHSPGGTTDNLRAGGHGPVQPWGLINALVLMRVASGIIIALDHLLLAFVPGNRHGRAYALHTTNLRRHHAGLPR